MYQIDNIINTIIQGHVLDILKQIPDESIHMCITSPPYWGLRNYSTEPQIWDENKNCEHEWGNSIIFEQSGGRGYKQNTSKGSWFKSQSSFCKKCGAWKGELGNEPTFDLYIKHLCDIFDEIKRVLKKDGSCWVNIGDTYWGSGRGPDKKYGKGRNPDNIPSGKYNPAKGNGYKNKCLCCIPDRFRIEMINRGWINRNEIIWGKGNAMPSSVKDRFTVDYEKLYFFTKQQKYYFQQQLEEYKSKPQKPVNKNKQQCNNGYFTDRFSPGSRNYYSKGKRNKRCVWLINTQPLKDAHFACVSEDTECLTIQGWKKYNQLMKGEIIASFDLKSKKLKWERLDDIYVYDYDGYLIETLNLNSNFLYTPNHRVVCFNWRAKTKRWSDYYIKEAKDLSSHDRFPVCADWEDGSYGMDDTEPNGNISELLGWIVANGHFNKYSITIYQSLTKNKDKVNSIEQLLIDEKIEYTKNISTKLSSNRMAYFTIAQDDTKKIFTHIPNKKPSWKMLLWSKDGIKRFLNGFIGGDDYYRVDGRIFITKDEYTADIIMALLFRIGCSVKKSFPNGTFKLYVNNKRSTSARKTNGSGLNLQETYYKGKVWCPKTPSTTFVARRNGNIIITGNTFPLDLVETPILAGCPEGGIVLDPFMGSGSTAVKALELNRNYIGIELNPEYIQIAEKRIAKV